MKYEKGRWLAQMAPQGAWSVISHEYLSLSWVSRNGRWEVLDEANDVATLNWQQADFYALIFQIVPVWEKLLTEQPEQADHRLDHPAHQVGTFEWIGDGTLHASLVTICRLRRESNETPFEEVERRLAHEGDGAARRHLTAIATLEDGHPEECRDSGLIVSAACSAASWFEREGEDWAPYLTGALQLTAVLEARYNIQARQNLERRLILSNMEVALCRQESRNLARHVMLLIASYCV